MRLYERALARRPAAELEKRSSLALSWDDYQEFFTFGGNDYPIIQTTLGSVDEERIVRTSVAAYETNGPVFALTLARMQVFSQIRFAWTRFSGPKPGDLFGSSELAVLERPWTGGNTADLLARMEMFVSTAGNCYVRNIGNRRLSLLRPEWVTIILGSQEDVEDPSQAADVEVVGYAYRSPSGTLQVFFPDEVSHYAPYPDPLFNFLGLSWITPVMREMQGDALATEHKARFFQNAATPNLVIKFDKSQTIDQVKQFKALMEQEHRGALNAYKTLFLGGGADVTPVGKDFKELDFAATQGKGESRLAAAAGVPPSWVGFSEGLQGSALNAGNFNSARRRFSDGTMVHLWTNAAASLQPIIPRPINRQTRKPDTSVSLWYDAEHIPFMREDAGDLASIQQKQASTITNLVRDGFTPESAVAAVQNNDFGLLVHTGLTSVQLLPPSNGTEPFNPNAPTPTPAVGNGTGASNGSAD